MNRILSGLLRPVLPLLACLLATIPALLLAESSNAHNDVETSIVKVHVTSKSHESASPWNSSIVSSTGSGFIIEGNRILTNAHVVADQTFIEVQRDGESKRYQAEVEAVAHITDLAVLKVKDSSFFAHSRSLPLGDLPEVHQEIAVYGYPVGGDSLSITKGIVSRIEFQTYAHSGLSMQAIQVDAAINFGNSGGPAISNGKVVGVAMQVSGADDENIGYIIPVTMVKRFLTDIADGKLDGLPELSLYTEELLNPTLKKHYQLTDEQSGVLVTKVCANTPTESVIQPYDVITHIDGKKIEDNGMTILTPKKQINYLYHVDLHQVGGSLKLDIVRAGKPMQVAVPLTKTAESVYNHYDKTPVYFVYGGFVFSAMERKDYCLSRKDFDKQERKDIKEYAKVVKVLASPDNIGFHDTNGFYIDKLNGKEFNTFKEFFTLLKTDKSPSILLEDNSGKQLAINRQQAESGHQALLDKYLIQKPQSDDVAKWEAELGQTQRQAATEGGKAL
ncbi:MAG TPA: trypsin-like peptidase domain-containing protein [Candidatus Thiothrix moscowensis]|uniref:S1C family serine protease n=1 Tax=unclassified Thiothrix TaxID=2636184 RepID=UPI0025CFC91D|nr:MULTISPECIES: S1C family serine protease [unclassified Thiothrix]HRJ51485.1 trypsin-like peptidase domain-containing protein [Candidatus Thiothrix moscowensis]HRJ91460.1 trypsin-like peptidase domain-containing protein [Candidatus Thiothrix moscowensis]